MSRMPSNTHIFLVKNYYLFDLEGHNIPKKNLNPL